jgi:hypothetical protein
MKKPLLFVILIAAILISLAASPGLAQKTPLEPAKPNNAANPAISPWFVSWADKTTSVDVGAYPSIAYSPIDGLPYISYYDDANGNLMLASPAPNGGSNCGVNGSWWCRVVDGDGLSGRNNANTGTFDSIAFWSGTVGLLPEWKLGISYHDVTNNALMYAVYDKMALTAGTWTIMNVTSTTASDYHYGMQTSLKFLSTGAPRIVFYSYHHTGTGDIGSVAIAGPISSGGNCGVGAQAGKWQCDVINSGLGMGQYPSLGIGYNDETYFAYYDGGNGDLKYAYFAGVGGGNCGPGNGFECDTLDGSSADVGMSAALTAPQSSTDKTRIAYYDKTNGTLKYAHPVSSGNCGGGKWRCETIETIGAGLSTVGISMALDQKGAPIIAYENNADDRAPSMLNIARPTGAVDVSVGNCGIAPLAHTWQCDTIDSAIYGQGHVNVAAYTAVAVSSSGLSTIGYFETNDQPSQNSLKVAFQRVQVFLPFLNKK